MNIDEPKKKRLFDLNDRNSPTWRKLREHLQEKLQSLRARNDSDLDAIATAKLRGEIRAIRNTLALGEIPTPAEEADEE